MTYHSCIICVQPKQYKNTPMHYFETPCIFILIWYWFKRYWKTSKSYLIYTTLRYITFSLLKVSNNCSTPRSWITQPITCIRFLMIMIQKSLVKSNHFAPDLRSGPAFFCAIQILKASLRIDPERATTSFLLWHWSEQGNFNSF